MSDNPLLDRIASLVALAASTSIEEARTAAHKACSLMREHNVQIGFLDNEGNLRTRPLVDTRSPRAAKKAPVRERKKTPIFYRCSICGSIRDKDAAFCAGCIDRRRAVGVWTVDCESCSRSSPSGSSAREANDIAFMAGFRIDEDNGKTLCPRCVAAKKQAGGM